MVSVLNSLKLFISSKRLLKKYFRSMMPEMAYVELEDGFKMYLSMVDVAGPSFDLGYDKVKAFYQYEKRDKDLIEPYIKSDGVFLDVGANIGHFSFYFKRKFPGLTCHLFEPIPWLESCIKRTMGENHLTNIYHHPCALGDENKERDFFIDTFNDGGHSLIKENISHRSQEGLSLKVSSKTLDSFHLERVDFIKVDVQGGEKKFICGATETIKKFRPNMFIEVANDRILSFMDFLENETGLNYDVFFIYRDGPVSASQLQKKCSELTASGVLESNFLFKVKN